MLSFTYFLPDSVVSQIMLTRTLPNYLLFFSEPDINITAISNLFNSESLWRISRMSDGSSFLKKIIRNIKITTVDQKYSVAASNIEEFGNKKLKDK